ncbi:MAG: molybdopterin molybdotransferase MoeA [Proteobacteria bacterium]|nr:molybdopterin molybdotransferase MoeA [Pseudomonadota bacterium]
MKEFFQVVSVARVLSLAGRFSVVQDEESELSAASGRVLAEDITAPEDLPPFSRSTMDGFAVDARSSFGASPANAALLSVVGTVDMGQAPDFPLGPGQAARIATGGMLPLGADAVVMKEQAENVDETLVEVYRSVAPGENVLAKGEDAPQGSVVLSAGTRLRAQELALLAGLGITRIRVRRPVTCAILSTGDEVVPADEKPGPGKIRDMNTHALLGQCLAAGFSPVPLGLVPDNPDALFAACEKGLSACDCLLISGGSSVGARDYTVPVIQRLPDAEILVHGVAISPGKPTILASAAGKPVWGLPGHVTSSMVVFEALVRPFTQRLAGLALEKDQRFPIPCRLTANVAAAQGRVDYVRVRLIQREGEWWAEPVFGKSGEIRTMVAADALVPLAENSEGADAGAWVEAYLI